MILQPDLNIIFGDKHLYQFFVWQQVLMYGLRTDFDVPECFRPTHRGQDQHVDPQHGTSFGARHGESHTLRG